MRPQTRSTDLSLAAIGAALLLLSRNLTGVDGAVRLSIELVAWGCLAVVVVRLTSAAIVDRIQKRRGLQATSLVRALVTFVLGFIAAAVLLRYGLQMDVGRVLGASALLTAVLGFALQATLSNVFAGLALQLEEPFTLGQIVRVGDVVGRVEGMTWRAVHLRTEEQSLVVLPNGSLGEAGVEVLSGDQLVERVVTVDVAASSPPARVQALLESVASAVPNVAAEPPVEVYPAGLRDYLGCRTFEIQYFPIDYLAFEPTEAEIRLRAWYALNRFGLQWGEPPTGLEEGPQALLRRMPLFAGLSDAECDALAEVAEVFLFAEGERLDQAPAREPSLWLLARGRLVVFPADPEAPLGELPTAVGDVDEGWSRRELRDLSEELTEHLGPVSTLLVRREARKTADPRRLRALLAAHIEDPERRSRFCQGTSTRPTWELVAPVSLEPGPTLRGERGNRSRFEAGTEVKVVRVPMRAVQALATARPGVATDLAAGVARWAATWPEAGHDAPVETLSRALGVA